MPFQVNDAGQFFVTNGLFYFDDECCCSGVVPPPGACYKLIPCQDTNACGSCDPPLYDSYEVTFEGIVNNIVYENWENYNGTWVVEWVSSCTWEGTVPDAGGAGVDGTVTLEWDGFDWYVEALDTSMPEFWYWMGTTTSSCVPIGSYPGQSADDGDATVSPLGTNTTVSGQIIVDDVLSGYTSGNVFGYSDKCYTLIGETACVSQITMGSWDDFADCADCAAPASCPTGLSGDYRLASYTNGDLTACAGCTDDTNAPWDGSFTLISDCYWEINVGGSWASIDGKLLAFPGTVNFISLASNIWTVIIACDAAIIWKGTKAIGASPAGTYYRALGCDTTSSLVMEEIP